MSVKIFPSIGIARIGNSPEWYLGPELPFPAPPPVPEGGKYKDNQCRIKRQAQRFHLWGYFDDGSSRELTTADGSIQWKVHLANAKAVFQGEAGGLIDLGPRTLNGPNDSATFANGIYAYSGQTVEVPLGEASTDAEGRLIVVGGFGFSSSPVGNGLTDFWQNDGWHDDIADGPVNAAITVGGQVFQAVGAWVICAPPRYAPNTCPPADPWGSDCSKSRRPTLSIRVAKRFARGRACGRASRRYLRGSSMPSWPRSMKKTFGQIPVT